MPSFANPETAASAGHIPIEALRDSNTRKELSSSAFRLFENFCDRWDLNENQRPALLGDIHRQTYQKWKRDGVTSLSRDQLERISILLGIHKGLRLLFADHDSAERWFLSNNHDIPYGGLSPVNYLMQGSINNLYEVRRYLDAWRGLK